MGYSPSLFWDCSLAEVYDLMESYNRKQEFEADVFKAKMQANASLNSVLARQIGEYVSCLLDKDARLTPLEELLPGLFEVEQLEEVKVESELAMYKAKMGDFAFWHNAKMKRKGGGMNE